MKQPKTTQQQAVEALVTTVFRSKVVPEIPKGLGVALLVFDMGDGGYMGYTSNAQREGMINALRECADRLESKTKAGN